MNKMIFAKATTFDRCAIVVFMKDGDMFLSDAIKPSSIEAFLSDIKDLAIKHQPELVQYECGVYLQECSILRKSLQSEDIKVRGYKTEGNVSDKIISQASWIESNVVINEKLIEFANKIASFSTSCNDKDYIELDVLSDATKFLRRYN